MQPEVGKQNIFELRMYWSSAKMFRRSFSPVEWKSMLK